MPRLVIVRHAELRPPHLLHFMLAVNDGTSASRQ
jgi:hypothetical protein